MMLNMYMEMNIWYNKKNINDCRLLIYIDIYNDIYIDIYNDIEHIRIKSQSSGLQRRGIQIWNECRYTLNEKKV